MNRFAIYSPVLGERKDFPNILLSKTFTDDNSNVQLLEGRIRTAKMRNNELLRNVYDILSISTSANTITIDGDYVSAFPNGISIGVYDTENNYEQLTTNATSTLVGGDTVITVSDDITNATPSTYVFVGTNVASLDPSNVQFRLVQTPDGNPVMKYHRLIQPDGDEILSGYTSAHMYKWNNVFTRWDAILTTAGTVTHWSVDKYGNYVVATNNIDAPFYWDGDATSVTNLDTQLSSTTANTIDKAKYIKSYRNYIFLAHVEVQGTTLPDHVYWSNIGDGVAASGFRQDIDGDAGSAYIEGEGDISGGLAEWQGYLVIFKRWSTRKMWFVVGTNPFQQDELNKSIGCIAPDSVAVDANSTRLYFYGSDKSIREVTIGRISTAVDEVTRDITPDLAIGIKSMFVDEYDEIYWAIPHGSGATANNKVMIYKDGRWCEKPIAITAFGQYVRQLTYTWDTIPFDTWDAWGWDTWDSISGGSDYPVDICSDADGYTYELHGAFLDKGAEYTSHTVLTTDLANKQGLPDFKRLQFMYPYFLNVSSGTATIEIKADNAKSWTTLSSVSMTGDEEIIRVKLPVSHRGRHFLIKISTTGRMEFIGCEFEFTYLGRR